MFFGRVHNFTTDAFASILAEARKYRLSLVIGHQYLAQVSEPVRAAVFGNVGTLISFQLGHDDAEELAGEFAPYVPNSLTGLNRGDVCVRSIMGGMTGEPFFGKTIREVGWSYASRAKVVEQSRRRWGRRREEVEAAIARWTARSN